MRDPVRVHRVVCLLLAAGIAASTASAQPVISTPVNQGSFIPPDLPLWAVAQGSMFAIFGLRMAPDEIVVVDAFPLSTELAGTSVQVTVGGVTVDCFMVFTLAGQVAAILPSGTPVGDGTITLTYNGEHSNEAQIRVVEHSVGMFALRQDGRGPGIFTDPGFALNTITNAFAPGSIAIAWLTGLGARTADDRAVPQDLKRQLDLVVKVGGNEAKVHYAGPSGCCAGVDQVSFEIPPGPEGCFVPVVMLIGESVSNFVSLAISSTGTTCSDGQGFLASEIDQMEDQGSLTQSFILPATAFLSNIQVGGSGGAPEEPQGVSFGSAAFQRVTFRNYPLTGFPIADNTCSALFGNRPDNPFAPVPLAATGDLEIRFPSADQSINLSDSTQPPYLGLLPPGDLIDGFYQVTDENNDLTIAGLPAVVPPMVEGPGELFVGRLDQDFAPGASAQAFLSDWEGYYAGTGQPPTSFRLDGTASLPADTVLQLSGSVTIDAARNLTVGYACAFDVLPSDGDYLIPPETFANFPTGGGPLTGFQNVILFPKNATRVSGTGPIDLWTTTEQLAWLGQYIETPPFETFATTATGNQVVPPTGPLFSANCSFSAADTGVSGTCLHNMPAVTGLSMNLGAPGENGTQFFFTAPDPGDRIDFGVPAGELDPGTPIEDVLGALRSGTRT